MSFSRVAQESTMDSHDDECDQIVCYDDTKAARENFTYFYGTRGLSDLAGPKWGALNKIVVSPGLPSLHKVFSLAKEHNIEITSDIDLLYEENPAAGYIGITGTNGKSTTTALIAHILKSNGLDYQCGGNIGVPALSLPLDSKGYVLELSSYQLDLLRSLKLEAAVMLNITPDHLERYGSMEKYIESKAKIFSLLKEGAPCVIGVDNQITQSLSGKLKKAIFISALKAGENTVTCLKDKIIDNFFEKKEFYLKQNKFLLGAHNQENIAASYATCRYLGIAPEDIITSIESFIGLPHRMQYLGTHENISFYNDSKATNAEAAAKSIDALENIYWLAGGIAKEGGIESLAPLFSHIKKAYLFGQDKLVFAKTLEGKVPYQLFGNMEEAFNTALSDARNSGAPANLLLAPAAASFDQFKNFEERGEKFTKLYNNIIYSIDKIL